MFKLMNKEIIAKIYPECWDETGSYLYNRDETREILSGAEFKPGVIGETIRETWNYFPNGKINENELDDLVIKTGNLELRAINQKIRDENWENISEIIKSEYLNGKTLNEIYESINPKYQSILEVGKSVSMFIGGVALMGLGVTTMATILVGIPYEVGKTTHSVLAGIGTFLVTVSTWCGGCAWLNPDKRKMNRKQKMGKRELVRLLESSI
jgi:hypothetical protein